MDTVMFIVEENDTFECTTLPPGRNAVGERWVFNKNGHSGNQWITYLYQVFATRIGKILKQKKHYWLLFHTVK